MDTTTNPGTSSAVPNSAWKRLTEGNARYVAGTSRHAHQDPERRASLAGGQDPFALVFGCSDSRVPAEVVFDQGLGDLFVVRTAGHVADGAVLGSIEFGIAVLGIPLVLVLGHTSCGAVAATVDAVDNHRSPQGFLRDIVERVSPAVFEAREDPEAGEFAITIDNVRNTCRGLREKSAALDSALRDGATALVGALYHLDTGKVEVVHREIVD